MTLRLSAPIFSATLFLAAGLSAQEPNLYPEAPAADQNSNVNATVGLAPPTPGSHALTPKETELLKQYDRNGSGKIDEEDLAAAHETMRQKGPGARNGQGNAGAAGALIYSRLLAGFDQNHEGRLNPGEQAEAMQYLQEHNPVIYQNILQRFDQNGDGKLDAQETAAAFATLEKLSPQGAPGTALRTAAAPGSPATPAPPVAADGASAPGRPAAMVYERLLQGFDKNHDGQLDVGEQAEAIKYVQEHNPRLYQFLAQRFGTDGKLDAAGTAKAFETLKKQSARTASR